MSYIYGSFATYVPKLKTFFLVAKPISYVSVHV